MDLYLRRYRSMVTVAELDWIVENTVTCDSRPNSFLRPLPSCYTCETSMVSSRNHRYHHGIIGIIKKSLVSSRKWCVRQHGRGRHHHGSGACGNTGELGHESLQTLSTGLHSSSNRCHNSLRHKSPKTVS